MMCSAVVDLLEPLHDGELAVGEQVRVENHLALCAACHATARELREVREMMSAALGTRAPHDEAELSRDLDAMSQSVVSRVRSEREASWPVQVGRAFEDLHFVYAGLGAMSATASCILAIAALLYFAPAQRDDSLSGLLAAMAEPGSNRNPVSLDERMVLPRVADGHVDVLEGLPETSTPNPSALAVAGVLTQEGIVAQASFLPAKEDDELERRVMQAVSSTRFRPAQRHGSPVAVNLIWLFEQTTVRGKLDGKI
jgi:predicted anti-sigma-YlaC factor YlaD